MSCLDTIHLYLHDTVHFGTGKDRKATPRPDGVLSIYIHLILPGPSLLQPVISKTSSVRGGTPREKKISQIFHNFCRRGGSERTFFDAPVKCFDPIQEVLFINSKCNFGIKVGEYSKGGNGCNLFSNKFFFLSKESLLDKVDNLNKTISKKRL